MTAHVPDNSVTALRRLAAHGAGWNYAGSAVTLGTQVAYTALTARMISPSGFGAYATAQAMVAFVGYFTLTTIGAAVMRRADAPRDLTGSALLLAATAGCLGAAVAASFASVWAGWWHAPSATPAIRVFAIATAAILSAVTVLFGAMDISAFLYFQF